MTKMSLFSARMRMYVIFFRKDARLKCGLPSDYKYTSVLENFQVYTFLISNHRRCFTIQEVMAFLEFTSWRKLTLETKTKQRFSENYYFLIK